MIPPMIGFFSKIFVIKSIIDSGFFFLALIVILTSVISAVYYLKIVKLMFNNIENNSSINLTNDTLSTVPCTASYIIAILTLFILLFILYPAPILNSIHLIALYTYYC